MNLKGFKPVDWTIVVTGVASLVALFLPWWGVSAGRYGISVDGWNTDYGWFGGLLVVGSAAWYVLARGSVGVARLPGSQAAGTAAASLLGLVIIVVRWIALPRGTNDFGQVIHYGGRPGIWIAAAAAAVQTLLLALLFRRSGESLPWRS